MKVDQRVHGSVKFSVESVYIYRKYISDPLRHHNLQLNCGFARCAVEKLTGGDQLDKKKRRSTEPVETKRLTH